LIYLRALLCLADEDESTVSSAGLAEACNVQAATIRKDLSYFGEFGKRGVGYDVGKLIDEIRALLNLDTTVKAALVGAGNIGRALLAYPGFQQEGLQITLAFDSDPDKVGHRIDGILIEDVEQIEERLQEEGIGLAILAVPVEHAPEVAQKLAKAGIQGILSFAPCSLNMPDNIKVTCVDLATEMARLAYYL